MTGLRTLKTDRIFYPPIGPEAAPLLGWAICLYVSSSGAALRAALAGAAHPAEAAHRVAVRAINTERSALKGNRTGELKRQRRTKPPPMGCRFDQVQK